MVTKIALITGINGQDGSYLAEFLLEKGYDVRMVSFDRYIESLRNKQSENNDVLITEDLSKLRKKDFQSLIDEALDRKDYVEVDRLMKSQK